MKISVARAVSLLLAAAVIPACGGSGGGGGGGGPKLPLFVIPGPGGLSLVTRGGLATIGNGGAGGSITIQGQSGSGVHSLPGNLTIDTAFAVPLFPIDLGANPRNITSDTTLTPPGTSGAIPGSAPGNATGLHLSNGATLTINPDTGGGGTSATLTFPGGVWIDPGCTIVMAQVAGTLNRVHLNMVCSVFVMSLGSLIYSQGVSGGALMSGGAGGSLAVQTLGSMLLQGAIDLSGGATSAGNGGNGGEANLAATASLYSTGSLATSGGTASGSGLAGGNGGNIILGAAFSGFFSSGSVNSKGGNGVTQGGMGGAVQFGGALSVGETVTSGDIDTRGGGATALNGDGGSGGSITVSTAGYALRATGIWTTKGGGGFLANGVGGDGGPVAILQTNTGGASIFIPSQKVSGGLAVAAAIDASGGNGPGTGAAGGTISIIQNLNGIDAELAGLNPVYVVGYSSYDTSGGAGNAAGGAGGDVQINNQLFMSGTTFLTFNGSAENGVDVITSGGSGSTANGGKAGTLQVFGGTTVDAGGTLTAAGGNGLSGGFAGTLLVANADLLNAGASLPDPDASVNYSGIVLGDGGAGSNGNGGPAARFRIVGHSATTFSGSVTSNGGTAAGGGSVGGAGIQGLVTADGSVSSTGTVSSLGGASAGGPGGSGGSLTFNAQTVSHVGDVTMNGGNGTAGGRGGFAFFNSQFGATTLHGTFSLQPGTGGTPMVGTLVKDGAGLALTSGVGTY